MLLLSSFLAIVSFLACVSASPLKRSAFDLNPVASPQHPFNRLPENSKSSTFRKPPRWLVTPQEASEWKPTDGRAKMMPWFTPDVLTSPVEQPTNRGYIRVEDKQTGKKLGFLGSNVNSFGEYGYLSRNRAGALLSPSSDSTGAAAGELTALNGPLEKLFPSFGAVLGSESDSLNLEEGSADYAYLAGVGPDSTNSFTCITEVSTVSQSSNLWNLDKETKEITASWLNQDGTTVSPKIIFVESEPFFGLTGNVRAFSATYGRGIATEVTFIYVAA